MFGLLSLLLLGVASSKTICDSVGGTQVCQDFKCSKVFGKQVCVPKVALRLPRNGPRALKKCTKTFGVKTCVSVSALNVRDNIREQLGGARDRLQERRAAAAALNIRERIGQRIKPSALKKCTKEFGIKFCVEALKTHQHRQASALNIRERIQERRAASALKTCTKQFGVKFCVEALNLKDRAQQIREKRQASALNIGSFTNKKECRERIVNKIEKYTDISYLADVANSALKLLGTTEVCAIRAGVYALSSADDVAKYIIKKLGISALRLPARPGHPSALGKVCAKVAGVKVCAGI